MKRLFAEDSSVVNRRSEGLGMTALHMAAEFGSTDVVAWLLLNGGDPQLVDNLGDTPLSVAAAAGHQPIVVSTTCARCTGVRARQRRQTRFHVKANVFAWRRSGINKVKSCIP